MSNDTLRPVPPVVTLVRPADSVGQRLKGKRILITGTARGVGAATQDLFARHGSYVSGCDIAPGGAAACVERACSLRATKSIWLIPLPRSRRSIR